MRLLIQSDRCPNKEIRTQTAEARPRGAWEEDGHLHIKERGLGRRGGTPALRLPELTGNRRLLLPRPGSICSCAAPEPVRGLSGLEKEGWLTPSLDGESSGRAGGPGMSLLGKSMCSSDARGQSRRGSGRKHGRGRWRGSRLRQTHGEAEAWSGAGGERRGLRWLTAAGGQGPACSP